MNFELDDDQRALTDAIARFAREAYPWPTRKADLALALGERSPRWSEFAALGLFGLLVPEAFGGMGKGAREAGIVAEELGRAMVVLPFAAHAVGAAIYLAHCESDALRHQWLPIIASGQAVVVVASPKLQGQLPGKGVQATAAPGGAVRLSGSLDGVIGADIADALIVQADLVGGGSTLVLVECVDPGYGLARFRNHDGTRGADLRFDDLQVAKGRTIAVGPAADQMTERVRQNLLAFICAEAVGTMGAGFDLTLDFLRSRQQFGAPLSSFQVLQHRCVDVLVAMERLRSLASLGAWAAGDAPSASSGRMLAAAKVQLGLSARFAGQTFIQLHGGMGMTDEYAAGHAFRRLTAMELALGTADDHVSVLMSDGAIFE